MTGPYVIAAAFALGALVYVLYPIVIPPPGAPAAAGRPACPDCGPRPEPGAGYCSNCGRRLST